MLIWCWPTVFDVGPALNQHCVNASCLLHGYILITQYIVHNDTFGGRDYYNNHLKREAQQIRDIKPMLGQCCPTVYDVGPTLTQHMSNVCWEGHQIILQLESCSVSRCLNKKTLFVTKRNSWTTTTALTKVESCLNPQWNVFWALLVKQTFCFIGRIVLCKVKDSKSFLEK